jgi:hypothetical protein
MYCCSYTSKYVSVRVQNVHVKLSSWDHAVNTLADAEEGSKPYWCSLIEQVQHPDWWPTTGHVPTYDQVGPCPLGLQGVVHQTQQSSGVCLCD